MRVGGLALFNETAGSWELYQGGLTGLLAVMCIHRGWELHPAASNARVRARYVQ
jgi:hypothetical protein